MVEQHHVPDRHADSVAVVTGSTHGIGLATVERLAREGAAVVVNDEGARDGEAVAADLRDDGADAIYVEADATDPDAIERLVDRTVEEFGRIDTLVNNVGTWDHRTYDETDLDSWEFVTNGTLRSHWLTTKLATEHMPDGASVVNISSIHAFRTYPVSFPYNVAKAGVNGLTRALALELGPAGIRVNGIMPGAIDISRPDASDEELTRDVVREPVGRVGAPRDIAAVVSFLASDDAGFVDGAMVPVDGGRTVVLEDDRYAEWWDEQAE